MFTNDAIPNITRPWIDFKETEVGVPAPIIVQGFQSVEIRVIWIVIFLQWTMLLATPGQIRIHQIIRLFHADVAFGFGVDSRINSCGIHFGH